MGTTEFMLCLRDAVYGAYGSYVQDSKKILILIRHTLESKKTFREILMWASSCFLVPEPLINCSVLFSSNFSTTVNN